MGCLLRANKNRIPLLRAEPPLARDVSASPDRCGPLPPLAARSETKQKWPQMTQNVLLL
jgi:hypothetical protein